MDNVSQYGALSPFSTSFIVSVTLVLHPSLGLSPFFVHLPLGLPPVHRLSHTVYGLLTDTVHRWFTDEFH